MGNNLVNKWSRAAPIAFILWTPLVSKGRVISICFQDKPFNITVVQVYAPTTDAKEAEVEQFCEDLQDLLELTHTHTHTHKMPFHHRLVEYKSGESRDTWSNRQRLTNTLFQQHNTREASTHGHHQMVNTEFRLIIFLSCKDKTWSWLWLTSSDPYCKIQT